MQFANEAEYEINDYTPEVVYTMIKHIYGFWYHQEHIARSPSADETLDFWILVAHEYQVSSLTTAVTKSILNHLDEQSCRVRASLWPESSKKKLYKTLQKISELYGEFKLSDTSCLDGIAKILTKRSFWVYEQKIQVSKIMESSEPICARLIREMGKGRKYSACRNCDHHVPDPNEQ
ncbi:unnamed protein product [Aureobasidium vineae]|uniref:BTB domain-containing protein n=1 Tax=Aureobasidium vineae TaxID=2773715 RepID=A0A9N8P5N3_9PEZI|nr:unnamed protein product [Aureobasidium vineae]